MATIDRPSNAALDAVLATALDAVVVMRMDGTIACWNDNAERVFGWTAGEVEGRRMSEVVIPPQYREAHEQGLVRYLATGEGPVLDRHIEITALDRSGRELPVELSITHSEHFGEPLFLGFLRDISERHDAQRRRELMMRELNHRVKNMLAVVAGIAHQTALSSSSIADFQLGFLGRLESLAAAHGILMTGEWRDAPMAALATALLGAYAEGDGPRLSFGGDELVLPARRLISVSMILHELLTNATKYGALARADGAIALRWRVDDAGDAQLVWRETGVEGVKPPERRGFGARMIDLAARHELGGAAEWLWTEDGLEFRLRFPQAASADQAQGD